MSISQREYWNDVVGPRWVQAHEHLEQLLQPYAEALLERADLRAGQRVVDIGCGAGAITRAAARICGPGQVRGVDISVPFLRLATRLAAKEGLAVEFVEADVEVWNPGACVDRILSRFGIMFFEHPEVAFANVRSWLAPGGVLTALCWQGRDANPWVAEAFEIVSAHVDLPQPDPDAPGPHSLADPDRLRGLLSQAGFGAVGLEDLELTSRIDGDKADILSFYREWGPTAGFYAAAPAEVQVALTGGFEALVDRQHDGTGIPLAGRAWAIRAS